MVKGVLMYSGDSNDYGIEAPVYRHRIKGSQQAFVFLGEGDAEEYAKRYNLAIQHKEQDKK